MDGGSAIDLTQRFFLDGERVKLGAVFGVQ